MCRDKKSSKRWQILLGYNWFWNFKGRGWKPIGYRAFRRAAKDETIKTVEPIYNRLLEAKKEGGILASKDELNKILKEKNMSYDDFINNKIKKSGLKGASSGLLHKFGL